MPGFQRMEAMARHRTYSIAFKRQVAQEYLAGESLHGLAKRHDLARNLIRLNWGPTPRPPISCKSTRRRSRRSSAWWAGRPWSSSS